MKRWLALLVACLALGLVAGCGDDDDDADDAAVTTEQPAETAAPEDTGEAEEADTGAEEETGGESVTVTMKDIKFDPRNLTVAAGTTVKWTNADDVPHTVTKSGGPGPEFDSGNVDKGGSFQHTFDEPGKIDYVCTIHPGQDGSVTVE